MPTFDFLTDMDDIFLASGFQEDIVYNGSTISAVVDRGGQFLFSKSGVVTRNAANPPAFKVAILVSKTDVSTVTLREDTVVLSHHGRTSDTLRVQAIMVEDTGAFVLGLS